MESGFNDIKYYCVSCNSWKRNISNKYIEYKIKNNLYNEYVCDECDEKFNNILINGIKNILINDNKIDKTVILANNYSFYSYYHLNPFKSPNEKCLGFCGREVIIKNINTGIKVITNDLYYICDIPKSWKDKFKKIINSELEWR